MRSTLLCAACRCTLSLVALSLAAAPCAARAADESAGSTPASGVRSAARPNILFCFADDWAWPHAGAYGDTVVKTPTFDRVAREGVLFTNFFVAAPTCTASRAAVLTGQAPHRLAESANLWSTLPARLGVYPDLLEAAGYTIGLERKGWGPGSDTAGGRTRNGAGPSFSSFAAFLRQAPADRPFCFWFGSHDPHRPYVKGSGVAAGLDPSKVKLPPWLPDTPAVRSDVLDYYCAVERFDRESGEMLKLLADRGQLENTIVVMSGDNGMPFPRAKATLYDSGTRTPLAIRWPARVPAGRVVDDLISGCDLAPTFLEAAGLAPPKDMTGRSFLPLLISDKSGWTGLGNSEIFTERERHAFDANGGKSYPARAIRTKDFLFILNVRPNLWPAGDPQGRAPLRDCDDGPSRADVARMRDDAKLGRYWEIAFGKRLAEQLFDLANDPDQMHNVAGQPQYQAVQDKLRSRLLQWMKETADPRAAGETDCWDENCPYWGVKGDEPAPGAKKAAKRTPAHK